MRCRGRCAALRARIAWPHPEWWALGISAAAWLFIVLAAASSASAGHDERHARTPFVTAIAIARDWLLMTMAMMFPLCVASIQATAARSLWRRRHRAIASWLLGYLAASVALGVVLSVVATFASFDPRAGSPDTAALAFGMAALWQLSTPRARALRQCHRAQPLAPSGWRATFDCVRYGWSTGVHCVATCGGLMVACWLLGHGAFALIAMAIATTIGLAERYMIRPSQRQLAAAIVVLAVLTASSTSW